MFLRFAIENVAEDLDTHMLVQSKTGGVATNALKYVMSKPRDGHTIFALLPGHLLTIMQGNTELTLDDIVPVVRGMISPELLIVKAGKYSSLQEYIESGNLKKIKVGGTGVGGHAHLSSLIFAKKAGIKNHVYVPFQKAGEITINIASGRIDGGLMNLGEVESQLEQGSLEVLAVLSKERLKALPEIPTALEMGVPYTAATIRGIGVLKGTPEDRIDALERALLSSMNSEGYLKFLNRAGQTASSIAGRKEWTEQITQLANDYREIGEELNLFSH